METALPRGDARRGRSCDPPVLGRHGTCTVGVVLLFALATCLGASAIDGFDFPDPETADRYQRLTTEFRCPKCLNESIASSGAPIAVDLRRTVRRLMEEGATDDAIRDHLQARYGDFVLYDPPFKPSTWFLWFTPVLLLIVCVLVLMRVSRRDQARDVASDDLEKARRLLRDSA